MQEENKLEEVRMQGKKNGKGMKRKQERDKPIRDRINDKSQQELTNDGLQDAGKLEGFRGEETMQKGNNWITEVMVRASELKNNRTFKHCEHLILDPGRNEVCFHHVTLDTLLGVMEVMANLCLTAAVEEKLYQGPRDL